MAAKQAVIFYSDHRWESGQPCFDVRFNFEALPRGAVVVGMVLSNGMGNVCPPQLNDTQLSQFEVVKRKALDAVGLIGHKWIEGAKNGSACTYVPCLLTTGKAGKENRMKIQFGTTLNGDGFWVRVNGVKAFAGRGQAWGEDREGNAAPYIHHSKEAVESLEIDLRSLGSNHSFSRATPYSESDFQTATAEFEIDEMHPVAQHFGVMNRYFAALQAGDDAEAFVCVRWMQLHGWMLNETNFDRMWIAYDLIKDAFSDSEKEEVLRWIDGIAQTQINTPLTLGNTSINNWVNHRDKLVMAAGILTGNQATIDAGIANYKHHMHGFYRPDGTTYDMVERDALAYQTYGVLPSVEMARFYRLNGGADLYRLKNAEGGSMELSVNYLLPFVRGEQTHTEFANTSVQSDRKRPDYGKPWDPANAVPMLESATFFNPILVQDLAIAAGKSSSKYPTFNSLVYAVQQP